MIESPVFAFIVIVISVAFPTAYLAYWSLKDGKANEG